MNQIYYLLGASCSGKTTVSGILSRKYDMLNYSGDEHRFDYYQKADADRHPYMTKKTNDFFTWSLDEMIEWEKGVVSEQTPMIIAELNRLARDHKRVLFEGMLDLDQLMDAADRTHICYLSVDPKLSEEEFYNRASHKALLDNIVQNAMIDEAEKNRRLILRRKAAIEAFLIDADKYGIVQFEREKYAPDKMAEQVERYFML